MKILALDIGTKTGWALASSGKISDGGSVSFKPKAPQKRPYRWRMFQDWLNRLHQQNGGIDVIYYEDVFRHSSRDAGNVYGGFWAFLEHFCEQHDVVMIPVAVPTIKKFWTGSGNAKKELMIAAARDRGFHPIDDNHADALALLAYALRGK